MNQAFRAVRRLVLGFGCAAGLVVLAAPANAAEPPSEGPPVATAGVLATPIQLSQPSLLAIPPGPATFIAPPVHAARGRERSFDTSLGERDPRYRGLPRTHRFRLALHAQWVRLPQTADKKGDLIRFHLAPIMLDLGYQAQFLKFVMVRLAIAAGANVANSRHAMPGVVVPQAYVGFQSKVIGLALGYAFNWTIPPNFGARDPTVADSIPQPVVTRNHIVTGELSATSRIDRVAMTFSLALGGMQSDLSHRDTQNRKWRFYMGLQAGMFFDATIRKERRARKRAEAK